MEHYIRSSILLIIYYELNNNDYILKHIYPTLYNPQKIKISVGEYVKSSVKFDVRCQVSKCSNICDAVQPKVACF